MSAESRASENMIEEFELAKDNHRDLMPISIDGTRFFGVGRIQVEILTKDELPGQAYIKRLRVLVGEGELINEMKAHQGHVRSVAYPAKTPSMVASAGPEMSVRIWHPLTGQLRRGDPGRQPGPCRSAAMAR